MDSSAVVKELIAARAETIRLRKIEEIAKEVVMYSKSTRPAEYTELEVLIDALGDAISLL